MADLDQHPEIKMRPEIFGIPELPDWGGRRQQTDTNRLAWLANYWRTDKAPHRIARGFKFQFDISRPQFNDLATLIAALRSANVVVVRLRRDDRVRHAISVIRAQVLQQINRSVGQNNGAHIYPGAPAEVREFADQPIEIDVAKFELALRNIAINTAYMDNFMAQAGVDTEITYERYLSDRLRVLNVIAQAIGVSPFSDAPLPRLTKNTSNDLSLAVSNLDEVAAAALRAGLAIN